QEVGDDYLNTMDRRAGGRPHNACPPPNETFGILLEASELPRPPIAELSKASITDNTFHVELQSQSKEDAQVNGTQNKYTYDSAGWKHPFVLYMDGILDEGNLGAAARSAYFFGVDAIVTPMRSSAPWSQIAIKASSGAAEAIPIFGVTTPVDFLGRSARNGWRIYASDIVPFEPVSVPEASTALSVVKPPEPVTEVVFTHSKSPKRLPIDHCPLKLHPTILMLGSEGEGLRQSLLSAAHFKVGIRAGRDTNIMGVDSLNVSAAASILCYEFSKRPRGAETLGEKVEEKLF
ncbi:alpha/beta knot, partial [Amniculicola lignicola CBS 123094]